MWHVKRILTAQWYNAPRIVEPPPPQKKIESFEKMKREYKICEYIMQNRCHMISPFS